MMKHVKYSQSRRVTLKALAATAALFNLPITSLYAAKEQKISRNIPGTDESLAIIGIGSARTFNINIANIENTQFVQVMQAFFDNGGQLVDTSPMYGSAETIIGKLIQQVNNTEGYFAATKVWANGRNKGINQMNASMGKMGVKVMDLMQIHNLRDWQVHIHVLREWKSEGKIRYTGITTSHGRMHGELAEILKRQDLDFAQFTYNIEDRIAEKTLFPITRDKGMGTLINLPFRRGRLFRKVKGKKLPAWATEFDCASWGQFFLKFIASHPDVTNIIPATTKLNHILDNMAAGFGRLPDPDMRRRMIAYMESI